MIVRDVLVAVLLLAATPAAARLEQHSHAVSSTRRGEVLRFIKASVFEGGKRRTYRDTDFIFDGDEWLRLDSERGWVLYLEVQHEENPDALE